MAFEHIKQLGVPHGFQCIAFPVGQDGLRFGEPALVHHEVGPLVNAVVQQLARGSDAEGQRVPVAPVMPGPTARMDRLLFRLSAAQRAVGLARAAADFQSADDAVGIGPVHGGVVLRIEAFELGEQGSQPFCCVHGIELRTDLWIGWNVVQTRMDRLHVEATPSGHDGHFRHSGCSARLEVAMEPSHGLGFESATAVVVGDRQEINEVMGSGCAFLGGGLGRADGDFPVELAAVRGEDFRSDRLGDADGKAGLANGGGAHHGDEQWGFCPPRDGGHPAQ